MNEPTGVNDSAPEIAEVPAMGPHGELSGAPVAQGGAISEEGPALPLVRPLVSLYKDGNYARLQVQYLGGDLWNTYRKAIEGAQYIRDRGVNLASFDKVPIILNRLKETGFDSWVEPSLKRVLQERTAQQWMDLKAAQDRIEAIDEELFKRTGFRLYPFQRTGSQWLTLRDCGLLADSPGLGKTIQSIVAIPANVPVLVIAPAVAKGVWKGEVAKWRPNIKVTLLQGRASFRWPTMGEMVVTNYDILPEVHDTKGVKGRKCAGTLPAKLNPCKGCTDKDVFLAHLQAQNPKSTARKGHLEGCETFLQPEPCPGCHPMFDKLLPNTVVIFDEIQYLKTPSSTRTKKSRAMATATREKEGRTWGLSGTPLENEPSELWSVFQVVGIAHSAFGDFKKFVALFKGKSLPFGGYAWGLPEDEQSVQDITERLRRDMLRRNREEVLPQLPTKVWREIEVDIDRKALAECDRFVKNEGGVERVAELLELEKINFETMSSVRAALATAKIPALLDFVKDFEEQKEILVVFSAHRAPIDTLARRSGWAVITGDVKAHKKREIEEKFQRGELKGVACTIRSGGVAITLTRAHHAIFVDLDWKPTANEQAEDRICVFHGQLVHTKRGTVPIEQVNNGDYILTHRGRYALVTKTKSREHRKLITEIGYKRHYSPLVTTHDHRILIQRTSSSGRPLWRQPRWIEAHKVMPGDFVVMPRWRFAEDDLTSLRVPDELRVPIMQVSIHGGKKYKNGRRKPLPEIVGLDDDLVRIFGWYLAEGFVNTRPGKGRFVSFSLNGLDETHIGEWIKNYLKKKFNVNSHINHKGGAYELRAYSADLAFWFGYLLGNGSDSHMIRADLMESLSERQAGILVESYFAGDGYARKNQQEWVSVSCHLSYQIAILCGGFGFMPSMRWVEATNAFIGGITKNGNPSRAALSKIDEQYVYNPVSSVKTSYVKLMGGKYPKVRDLTVKTDESFVVGLATVHNCRISQDRGCIITILKANHMLDKRVTEILHRKRKLITASVDAARITDDAPPDAELEAYVHKIQEEIAGGGAVRRMAEVTEQKTALEGLHKLVFENRGDERLAMSLAEEATTIGLSEKQWELAGRIVARGKPRELAKEEPVKIKKVNGATNGAHVVRKSARLNGSNNKKGEQVMPRVEKPSKKMNEKGGSDDEPSPLMKRVLLLVRAMSVEDREELFDRMGCEFCLMCGEEIPEDGGMDEHMKTCAYNEDDEDEADEDSDIPEDDSDLLEAKE